MEESKAKTEVPTGILVKRIAASTHQSAQTNENMEIFSLILAEVDLNYNYSKMISCCPFLSPYVIVVN